MSEKTLGEVAYEAALPYMIKAGGMTDSAFQAAADAIAAPLLARIAALEGALAHMPNQRDIWMQDERKRCLDIPKFEAAAYQRGVADGLEQARNLMEANGMEWAAGKIAEAIRNPK